MQGHDHSVSKTSTCHEMISCVEHLFTQFPGRIFRTTKDPDD
jgi:hypothetical protein